MVRVSSSLALPLILLAACATGQAQTPVAPPTQVNLPPAQQESLSDCARKSSVAGAWSCIVSGKTSP